MAPNFTLPDQTGKLHTLTQYRGQWVLVYFYPKDDTPGCTIEACNLRDHFLAYRERNIVILGISKDSVHSHAKFVKKYTLPFTLLADETGKVCEAYHVWNWKRMFGKTFLGINRTSFLIDPAGNIAKQYENVKPDEHASEVLDDVAKLQ